jgi:hypothetical protein
VARNTRRLRNTGVVVGIIIGIVVGMVVAAVLIINAIPNHPPLPGEQRCVATAAGRSVAIDTGQAHYASIIAGLSVRRGLAPRAASIALTTAYQESGLRNLGHGDRDSVGLFQQRPSMGWGTRAQLLNPYYATNRFYSKLVKVPDWENGDITEIAQKIQISAYPEAYREHEADGRALASVLTGQSPAGITCLVRDEHPGNAAGLSASLHKTFGIRPKHAGQVITISADSATLAWAYGQHAVANARGYGVTNVQVGNRALAISNRQLPSWKTAAKPIRKTAVRITFR